jgi:hypothetical protein
LFTPGILKRWSILSAAHVTFTFVPEAAPGVGVNDACDTVTVLFGNIVGSVAPRPLYSPQRNDYMYPVRFSMRHPPG